MAKPSSTRKAFIGRSKEIAMFRRLLDAPNSGAWILNVYGDGGIGKTWLLEQFRRTVQEEYEDVFVPSQFVDFYFTANQHEFGILRNLATQFPTGAFHSFERALSNYEKKLEGFVPVPPEEQQDLRKKVYDDFEKDYRALSSRKRIVLLFDTAEEAGEAGVHLYDSVLPRLKGNTVVVIAGRKPLSLGQEGEAVYLPLSTFDPNETVRYFREQDFDEETLSDEEALTIWQRTSGQPILIALAAKVLEQYPNQDLLALSGDEFPDFLLTQIYGQDHLEHQAILYMAQIWRRFDTEILAYLFDWEMEESRKLIQRLSQLPFVKYRPEQMGSEESCLLHDQMRDMVKNRVWADIDRDGVLPRELCGRMVAYYAKKLALPQSRRDQQSLICEQLFYQLQYDVDKGVKSFHQLFKTSYGRGVTEFCEALNSEVQRYKEKYSRGQPWLDSYQQEFDFSLGWVALRREQHPNAIRIWEDLVADADTPDPLQALVLTFLAEAYADNSEFDRAEERGTQAIELYQHLKQFAVTEEEKKELAKQEARLYNNLGFLCRRQDRWSEAIEYYKKALATGPDSWLEARIRNNLGYVYNLHGRSELAFSFCETALYLRQRLGDPYELGLSYNTLGILYVDSLRIPEAEASFRRAIINFEQDHSERGKALVYTALGRLYRQWGWYQEHIVGEPFCRDREQYKKALNYLQEAEKICEWTRDEGGQAEALAELGCTYRERCEWSMAVTCLEKALSLARKRDMHRREADILQDLSITYWRQNNLPEAKRYAQEAHGRAQESNFPYMQAKSKWTLGDIAFEEDRIETAFQEYADACVNMTQLDPSPDSDVGHDSAKKKLHYEDLVKHIEGQILRIKDSRYVEAACRTLVERWQEAGLEEEFPGFIERIRAISNRYELLKESEQGDADAQ